MFVYSVKGINELQSSQWDDSIHLSLVFFTMHRKLYLNGLKITRFFSFLWNSLTVVISPMNP